MLSRFIKISVIGISLLSLNMPLASVAEPVKKDVQPLIKSYLDCIKDPNNKHPDTNVLKSFVSDMAACDKQAMALKKEVGPEKLLLLQVSLILQLMKAMQDLQTPKTSI